MTITAVVQARMGSSRLPGKVMAPLAGVPLIEVLLHRLSQSSRITSIVLATSEDGRNDPLAAHVEHLGYRVFRGSEHDVLSRFYLAAAPATPDVVVRITGDCPLLDAALVDSIIDAYLEAGVDYATNTNPPTYPDGLDVEVMSFGALTTAYREATTQHDREHVTPFIRTSPQFRRLNVTSSEDHSAQRWTVDEPEDLAVVSAVFAHFAPATTFTWEDALAFFETRPELTGMNQTIPRNEGATLSDAEKRSRRHEQAD
jgi:glutamate-1-semialdehyde 2,1-aminomutase